MNTFDIIVIGAGHAGLEAAFANANIGLKVCLLTLKKEGLGSCPCNPSVGGPAKGIVTREIDALGGMQSIAADTNQLQIKVLNESKGAGVWAIRAQIDKIKYEQWFLKKVESHKNIELVIDEVIDLIVEKNKVCGVVCKKNKGIKAKCVVITSGTYMKPVTFSGFDFANQGPIIDWIDQKKKIHTENCQNAFMLSENLKNKYGFEIIRLKTGTPPRIFKDSIDFSILEPQYGSVEKVAFEHYHPKYLSFKKQVKCYLTYTNEKTHEIIRQNLDKSPMYAGVIKSTGPRYCPSIEDKVVRFSDKLRHQLFVEPESLLLDTYYLQGFSTALPNDVQDKMIRTIAGLENCKIQRYAYAIEYDAINPIQLFPTLESKKIQNLFFAGQVNGTSGYEEAAGQGIIAGINAGLKAKNKPLLVLKRNESYIGVMIDDITTKGISDPYRLLTSRAEYRLFLRNDNAEDRLIKYGYKFGTISKARYYEYKKGIVKIENLIKILKNYPLSKKLIKKYGNSSHSLYSLLKRPEVKLKEIIDKKKYKTFPPSLVNKIEINVKYEGYIKSQQKSIEHFNKLENISLEKITDYKNVKNLSLEARDKLNKIRPLNLNQAQRIQGINSSDIINIKYYIDKNNKK